MFVLIRIIVTILSCVFARCTFRIYHFLIITSHFSFINFHLLMSLCVLLSFLVSRFLIIDCHSLVSHPSFAIYVSLANLYIIWLLQITAEVYRARGYMSGGFSVDTRKGKGGVSNHYYA